ncbi:hypothetical protein FisN_15Lh341 [Fistulifera solaris]|uniref:Uncharacterized protein n=1 Tax=Fistulifera solaris TaxID=1519565 RepID=A0A1Z5JYS1_FISSO|nr:hypothetical protein FisN_15Lh341 [Fistulifera solaris]|eukprot:GAX19170.1 hypothetical protein FisN_15Lh341 [Fistulifera solaris]
MLDYSQVLAATEAEAAASNLIWHRRALEQLHDSLAQIPLQQQSAYREALVRCPQLVQTESDPMQFLVFADFNSWNAATRIITYWEKRRELFGERAFLPVLDLSGNGALAGEDLMLFSTGSFQLTAEDTVVVDRSLEPDKIEFSIESTIRRYFFILQLLSRHRVNALHGKGYQVVIHFRTSKRTENRVASKTMELSSKAFPAHLKAIHLVLDADAHLGFVENAYLFFRTWQFIPCHFVVHHCETPAQALVKLIPHGILPNALPPTLGGNYQSSVEYPRFLAQFGFVAANALTSLIMDHKSDATLFNLECLHGAIDLLPESDKTAYIEAIQRTPDLVEAESPPLRFLEFDDFNYAAAAIRLCNYWKYRVDMFGDRAFLPMTINGAMGPDGEMALELGSQFLLRNGNCGRSVWCGEPLLKMSSDPEVDLKMRVKVLYYVASKVLKILSRFVIISCPSGWSVFTEFCCKFLVRMFTTLFGEDQNIHFSVGVEAQEEMHQKFEALGVTSEGLPKKAGGQDGPMEFLLCQRLEENHGEVSVTNEVASSAIKAMRTALALIPNGNKAAYLEALDKAPELSEQESLWERFLRFTNCNATKAANMYAKYWEVRKDLFGDRAFLPLNQTFEGAVERKDVTVLQTGYLMQLPCVESGQSVLYCDGTKLQKSTFSSSRARCKFYMLSIMSENVISQMKGFNLLYFWSDPSFDRVFKEHFVDTILPVMPVRVHEVHILGLDLCPADVLVESSMEARLNKTKRVLDFQQVLGAPAVETHVGTSREDLLQNLLDYGYSRESLPKALFGLLGFDDFVKWQELRVRYEWGLFTNSREEELSARYLIPRNKLLLQEEDSEKVERKRRMTIILSRRKRERERMSLESLQEEAMEQTDRNRKLQRLNETLRELVEKANEIVKGGLS